jgi:transketolase
MIDMRDAFFNGLYNHISCDKNVIILTADHGAFGLKKIEQDFPNQYLNVGISEQAMISIAAGLAKCGKKVYVYAINNFVSLRVLEQVNIDLCAMDLDVNIIGVGSGFTYATDGPTHHGVQDLSAMINLPNLQVFNVTDDLNTKKLVEYSYNNKSPKYFRIEKGNVPRIYNEKDDINDGLKNIQSCDSDTIVFSTGFITHSVLNVLKKMKSDEINVSHVDVYRLSPLPKDEIVKLAKNKRVITIEENLKSGGMGEKIFSLLKENNHQKEVMNISIQDKFYFNFGDRNLLHNISNLDESSLYEKIKNFII